MWRPSIKITSNLFLLFLKKLSEVSFILPPLSGSTPILFITGIDLKHILLSQPISRYLQLLNFCVAAMINDTLLNKILSQSI